MSRGIIITWDGFQDQEVIYPYHRLKEAGITPVMVANEDVHKPVVGLFGTKFDVNFTCSNIGGVKLQKDDLIILPGGVKALEKVRQSDSVKMYLSQALDSNTLIGSICHGAQLLISTGKLKGRKVSGYYSIEDDIKNAGAKYSRDITEDGNIISAAHYKDMGPWMGKVLDEHNKRNRV